MTLVSERIGQFFHDGHRLEYTEYGGGDRWVVLIHGQLMPRRMHQPLARHLAADGRARAHRRSPRPRPVRPARRPAAVLDVRVRRAGHHPARRPGDPVSSDRRHLARCQRLPRGRRPGAGSRPRPDRRDAGARQRPRGGHPGVRSAALRLPLPAVHDHRAAPGDPDVPRGVVPFWVGIGLDTLDQRPGPMAAAIHGIFFGRIAPSSRSRKRIEAPALVVGHPRDPIHPAADAAMLAEELPDSRFVEAHSILEWRRAAPSASTRSPRSSSPSASRRDPDARRRVQG